jgi:hypothetical protein
LRSLEYGSGLESLEKGSDFEINEVIRVGRWAGGIEVIRVGKWA